MRSSVFLLLLVPFLASACMEEPPVAIPQQHADTDMIPAASGGTGSSTHAITSSTEASEPIRYNREGAVAYARKYAEDPNPLAAYCRSRRTGLAADCTNFVSQALLYGGLPMIWSRHADEGWWYDGACDDDGSSRSWRQVNRLIYWLVVESKWGQFVKIEEVEPGDIVFYKLLDDFGKCTPEFTFHHSTMVTGFGARTGVPLVSYHTREVKDIPWNWSMRESGFLGLGDACSYVAVHIRD